MAGSVAAAVMAKYDTLTFSGDVPLIYFGDAPQTDAIGNQERMPYVVLRDNGLEPEYQSDFGGIEVGTLAFEAYGTNLAVVDAIVRVLKWGGSAPSAKAGMDFCTLTVDAPLYFISLVRTFERRSYAGFDYQGQRCHKCDLTYSVSTELRASG